MTAVAARYDRPVLAGLLRRAAAGLGTADPEGMMADVLASAFPLPAGDPAYHDNALVPGVAPLELVFSESEPETLRFTFEPGGPALSPAARRAAALETADLLASRAWRGKTRCLAGRETPPRPPIEVFGGFVGVSCGTAGINSVRVYTEVTAECVLPDPIGHIGEAAKATGLEPWMYALATDGETTAERHYLINRHDSLQLSRLGRIVEMAGLANRWPELLNTLLQLSGGLSTLPPGTFGLGVRAFPYGTELKCELLGIGGALVEHVLYTRPEVHAAYRTWRAAVVPPGSTLTTRVVSARIAPAHGVRLSLYSSLSPSEGS